MTTFHMTTSQHDYMFFVSGIVLQRNRYIRSAELFELTRSATRTRTQSSVIATDEPAPEEGSDELPNTTDHSI